MRMVEPELPQSREDPEGVKLPPTPVTETRQSSSHSTFAPRAATQLRLLEGSAPVEKLLKVLVPLARPLSKP